MMLVVGGDESEKFLLSFARPKAEQKFFFTFFVTRTVRPELPNQKLCGAANKMSRSGRAPTFIKSAAE